MSTVYDDPVMTDSTGQDIVTKLNTIAGLMGDGVIDDTSTTTDKTWSASKINTQLGTKANADLVPTGASTSNKLATASDVNAKVSWSDAGKSVKKNLLPPNIYTDAPNGVTYTQNSDGTITTSGTATNVESTEKLMTNANLIAWLNKNKGKSFTLNGCPSGGSHTTYYIAIWANNGLSVEDEGDGATFTIPSTDCTSANIAIHIKEGTNVTGKIWKPMLRLASIADSTYEPYIPDNTELMTWEANGVLGAKNLAIPKKLGLVFDLNSTAYENAGSVVSFCGKLEPNTDYIFSHAGGNRYRLALSANYPANGVACTPIVSNNDLKSYKFNSGNYNYACMYCDNTDATIDTIKPMLRLAADTDPTYQPYAMTNRELTENTQELKYRVGILSTPVPAYVSRCTPPRNKDITDDWFNGSLRAEIAAGNFKNVVPGDYIKDGNTIIWVANPDGMYNKGDQTGSAYQSQAYGQHHLEVFIKYMGSTSLWLGKGDEQGAWQVSANDKGRCPWNAAIDVDPTSTSAVGSNNTNISRTYNDVSVSGYMGSFVRERIDAVIVPYLQNLFGSANVLKFRNINGNAVATDKVSGGQGNWNGCTSGWAWYDRYVDLPSEIDIYGSRIFGSAYDNGLQCEQLPLFKNMQIHDVIGRIDFWTKAVASSSLASNRSNHGFAHDYGASLASWVCPLACIK